MEGAPARLAILAPDHHRRTAAMLIKFALTGVSLIVRKIVVFRKMLVFCSFVKTNENIPMVWTGCTAERVFRVDSGQEHLHYITDISTDCLYILDPVSSDADPVG